VTLSRTMQQSAKVERRKKSALERREQRLRAEGRTIQQLIRSLAPLQSHRGGQASQLGAALAAVSATPSHTTQPSTTVEKHVFELDKLLPQAAPGMNETPSHPMQQPDACEKPNLAFAAGIVGSSVSVSKTPSHAMQHSEACEKQDLVSAPGTLSSASESETPLHSIQHSDACEKPLVGGALGTGGFFDACEKPQSDCAALVGSVASDSKTPSHAMTQSAACEKPQAACEKPQANIPLTNWDLWVFGFREHDTITSKAVLRCLREAASGKCCGTGHFFKYKAAVFEVPRGRATRSVEARGFDDR